MKGKLKAEHLEDAKGSQCLHALSRHDVGVQVHAIPSGLMQVHPYDSSSCLLLALGRFYSHPLA